MAEGTVAGCGFARQREQKLKKTSTGKGMSWTSNARDIKGE